MRNATDLLFEFLLLSSKVFIVKFEISKVSKGKSYKKMWNWFLEVLGKGSIVYWDNSMFCDRNTQALAVPVSESNHYIECSKKSLF